KEAWTTFANVEKSWAYRQDQLPSTHPVAADMVDLEAVERNFDGITYAKGASVLKQLVAYVGLEPFLSGLRQYFRDHAFANASFADLVSALEASSGRDLSDWSDAWLRTTGINSFKAEVSRADDGTISDLVLVQGGAAPGAGELRMHRLGVGIYKLGEDGKVVRSDYAELDVTGERTTVEELRGAGAGDLVLVNDSDLTYCAAKLDESSLEFALQNVENVSDSLARTLVWSALWEMTRGAELPARRFVDVVSRAIGAESHIGVVQKVLGQAHTALARYADPDWAAAQGWPQFSAALLRHAQEAEPGSDHQLAFFTAFAEAPLRADDKSLMRDLLDGVDPATLGLGGLEVDTDLRWTVLTSLVAAGLSDAEDIDSELQRDNTASGARRAATARASRPDTAAKAQVVGYVRTTGSEAPSNALLRASLAGLAFPGHEHLLAGVADAYLETIDELWTARPGEIALTTAEMLFPAWSIDAETIAEYEAVAADEKRPAALRRTIGEKTDDLRRALAAREADSE
ncbi:ERAP1-like C-terminal domain-containing protein, partial [Dietzia sp.]|uniref:ERAP1-like C-terminal domain-containing protein n=1 Tax=Dietzia sp. TaxID=1871616 RepID=UPI002FD8DB7C